MITLPGFTSAEILVCDCGRDPGVGTVERVVHYRLKDRATLDDYLRNHARRMRDASLARFAGRFRATRRVLTRKTQYLPD